MQKSIYISVYWLAVGLPVKPFDPLSSESHMWNLIQCHTVSVVQPEVRGYQDPEWGYLKNLCSKSHFPMTTTLWTSSAPTTPACFPSLYYAMCQLSDVHLNVTLNCLKRNLVRAEAFAFAGMAAMKILSISLSLTHTSFCLISIFAFTVLQHSVSLIHMQW